MLEKLIAIKCVHCESIIEYYGLLTLKLCFAMIKFDLWLRKVVHSMFQFKLSISQHFACEQQPSLQTK
jgi:hypothetical protein